MTLMEHFFLAVQAAVPQQAGGEANLKIPDLTGSLGNGIHGQILLGSALAFVGAYVSVRFLMKYFQTRTLTPFAIYCVVLGLGSVIYLSAK